MHLCTPQYTSESKLSIFIFMDGVFLLDNVLIKGRTYAERKKKKDRKKSGVLLFRDTTYVK